MTGQRNSHEKRAHSKDHSENGGSKRRNHDEDHFTIGSDDTVYAIKIGSIIGTGGELVKQLRVDTNSKIRIGETVPRCDVRVVTIYSTSDETNASDEMDTQVCPAQDALFRVHDRVIAEELGADEGADDELEGDHHVTSRLLVPTDQIGCIIGKGGQIVQSIRSDIGAQICILKDDHLPTCAFCTDELPQISGEASVVRKALNQIASCLHDNPSQSQHMLTSTVPPSVEECILQVAHSWGQLAVLLFLLQLVVPMEDTEVKGEIGRGIRRHGKGLSNYRSCHALATQVQ